MYHRGQYEFVKENLMETQIDKCICIQDLISTNCGEFAFSLSEQERTFFVLYHQKWISKTAFT